MDYCIYEDIDKLDSLSSSSSEQNSNQSYDLSQKNDKLIIKANKHDGYFSLPVTKHYCQTPSFYFKNLNRNQSEALLAGHENGVFLIRNSVNFKGNLTLSFINNFEYEHYLIEKDRKSNVSINDDLWFTTVEKLIKHYQLNKENLSTVLTVGLSSNDLYIDPRLEMNIINVKDVKFHEFIGSGEFADVRKVEINKKICAVKLFKDSENTIKDCLHEAEIMSSLNNESILKIYGISIQTRILIYSEYMVYGCLLEYLRSRGRNLIEIIELIKHSYQVANGLEYLETKKIIHRDICAANILLSRYKSAKIGDFGSAISSSSNSNRALNEYSTKLRIKWTAPEALRGKNFSSKSDVWSFGILLWEIFSYGRTPYPRVPIDHIERYIMNGDRMKIPDSCNPEMAQIISSCWKLKPNERPSFKNLKKIISYLTK